jgi:hypothetical protein
MNKKKIESPMIIKVSENASYKWMYGMWYYMAVNLWY